MYITKRTLQFLWRKLNLGEILSQFLGWLHLHVNFVEEEVEVQVVQEECQ